MTLLEKYLHRISLQTPLPSDPLETLRTLHSAHLSSVPFENLGIHLGEKISLKIEDLERKLIDEKRGGYCFENNLLSFEVLKSLGLKVRLRGARVIAGDQVMPMSHLVLQAEIGGESWLYDVGFGGNGVRFPQNMRGGVQEQQFFKVRVRDTETQWILEKLPKNAQEWSPVYAIQKIDFHPIDCEVANYFTSTSPASIFTKTVTVQKFFSDSRVIYRKTDLIRKTVLTLEGEETVEVSPKEALQDISGNFGFLESFVPKIAAIFQ